MSEIGPGSIVVCVDTSDFGGEPVPLVLGAEYEVLHVWDFLPHITAGDAWMDCAVTLVNVPDPHEKYAWGLFRFRPKNDPLQSLLRKVDERVTVDA